MDAPECSVAHESWHIVNRIMGWCGVVDLDNEVIAYHIDHMVEKVYEFKKAILRAKSLESSTKKEASDGHN
jgi:hypothetical protein